MKNSEKYVVLRPDGNFGAEKMKAYLFETKVELENFLLALQKELTITKQGMTEFSYVIDRNKTLPADDRGMHEEMKRRHSGFIRVGEGFHVRRTTKKGKVIEKTYNFMEDFDWQISEWKAKEDQEILIWSLNEAHAADYYIMRDMEFQWGKKHMQLIL